MTTAITPSTTAPTNPGAQPAISTNGSKALRDTIYLELAVRARRAMDSVREIELCLESPWDAETDNDVVLAVVQRRGGLGMRRGFE